AVLAVVGCIVFFFQAEDGIRVFHVTGVQTSALPISMRRAGRPGRQAPGRGRSAGSPPPTCRGAPSPPRPAAPAPGRRTRGNRRRSEERRVGKEGRSRSGPYHEKRKQNTYRAREPINA